MPQITVKTEYILKLKQLGIYDQWFQNVKSQFGKTESTNGVEYVSVRAMETASNFGDFISASLFWRETVEGHEFWRTICEK
jgi:hypothetical protein